MTMLNIKMSKKIKAMSIQDYKQFIIQAQQLESSLGVAVLRHKEKKPDGGQYLSNFVKPIPPEKVAFVGDRIFTDILFGNRNGNLTIWTSQIITEEGDNKPALLVISFKCYQIIQKSDILYVA